MIGIPDETSTKLGDVMDRSKNLELAWKHYNFKELAVDVYKLREECDKYLDWAKEQIESGRAK